MSLLPTRMKKFQSKMKTLEWSQRFPYCKSMGIFFRRSRAANSPVHDPIRLNFELSPPFLPARMKKIRSKWFTTLYIEFLGAEGQHSVVCGWILPKFILIQAFMHILFTCKNEEDLIKNEGTGVFTTFLPLYVYGDFYRRSRQLTPQSLFRYGRIANSFEVL